MADVLAALRQWSTTVGSNLPTGSTVIGAGLDDNLRQIQATVRQYLAAQASNMVSASTVDLSTADGFYVNVTGTTTITGLGTEVAGVHYLLKFAGILTLTHNGTSLILPGAANITTAAGDVAWMISEGSGNWRCANYIKASGILVFGTQNANLVFAGPSSGGAAVPTYRSLAMADLPISATAVSAVLGSNVSLNNTGSYFTGPQIAQGTTGTWWVAGNVTLADAVGAAAFNVVLWDGTTKIASGQTQTGGANVTTIVSLAGYIASPAANLRISVNDQTSTGGFIAANQSGNARDSYIGAFRIG